MAARLMREADRSLASFFAPRGGHLARQGALFVPRVDLAEDEDAILVHADVPGVAKEDVDIELDKHNRLHLRGSRETVHEVPADASDADGAVEAAPGGGEGNAQSPTSQPQRHWHSVERQWGSFERVLQLPDNIDPDKIAARVDNGVLEVRVPKSEPVDKRRKITIA